MDLYVFGVHFLCYFQVKYVFLLVSSPSVRLLVSSYQKQAIITTGPQAWMHCLEFVLFITRCEKCDYAKSQGKYKTVLFWMRNLKSVYVSYILPSLSKVQATLYRNPLPTLSHSHICPPLPLHRLGNQKDSDLVFNFLNF